MNIPEPKLTVEQSGYRLQFSHCDVITTKAWKYCKNLTWLNISTGMAVKLEERGLTLYNAVIYSLHNPSDRTTDYNNEVVIPFQDLDEALDYINMLCG